MTNFKIIKDDKRSLEFQIVDVDLSIVNSIRRIIISEIPNVAFAFDPYSETNDIKINVNSCALHNEFLAHRISLIPICFDYDEIENFTPEKYRFVLKKKNTGTEIMNVTSKDFDVYNEDNVKMDEKFKNKLFPANTITKDHILITKLKPNLYDLSKGEEIDIECSASKNIALSHARWSPVSKCTFHNTIDEKAVQNEIKTMDIHEVNQFKTLQMYRHFIKNKYDEPSSFNFEIESECRLSPRYLVKKAFEVLIEKFRVLSANIDNTSKIEINKLDNIESCYTLNIYDETHTLLNVLQSITFNHFFRDIPPSSNPLEFIGYHKSHPLDNKMILKIKFKEDTDVKPFIIQQCNYIINHLTNFMTMWKEI
uniref:DNA-directed RNA polymerase RpoA/D/Rpb3-type domain-containing protein n=1 Tax=viral metagenome TaxID=1070528 RepID=A0A6C0BEK7_9ZZZZ